MTASKPKRQRTRADRPIAELIEAKFAARLAAVGVVYAADWLRLTKKARLSVFGIPTATAQTLDAAVAQVSK